VTVGLGAVQSQPEVCGTWQGRSGNSRRKCFRRMQEAGWSDVTSQLAVSPQLPRPPPSRHRSSSSEAPSGRGPRVAGICSGRGRPVRHGPTDQRVVRRQHRPTDRRVCDDATPGESPHVDAARTTGRSAAPCVGGNGLPGTRRGAGVATRHGAVTAAPRQGPVAAGPARPLRTLHLIATEGPLWNNTRTSKIPRCGC
jgi:hypothetical protein